MIRDSVPTVEAINLWSETSREVLVRLALREVINHADAREEQVAALTTERDAAADRYADVVQKWGAERERSRKLREGLERHAVVRSAFARSIRCKECGGHAHIRRNLTHAPGCLLAKEE